MTISKSIKTSGATKDYRFGQKNNWRRTVWNEVLRRTNGREKTQPILYLAGPEDIDRELAISKGVPAQNLVAIDSNPANVDSVRQGKNPAVCGDALDILWSWPAHRKVCAVMMDFCSGLSFNVTGIFDVFQRAPLRDAVVMVNFMRGRDAWSNRLRQILSESGLLVPLWRMGQDGEPELWHDDPKHRAYQFLLFHALDSVMAANGMGSTCPNEDGAGTYMYPELDANGNTDPHFAALVGMLFSRTTPKLYSYKSGMLTFDSAVFQSPLRNMPEFLEASMDDSVAELEEEYKDAPLARKISAMLAVRTTRL